MAAGAERGAAAGEMLMQSGAQCNGIIFFAIKQKRLALPPCEMLPSEQTSETIKITCAQRGSIFYKKTESFAVCIFVLQSDRGLRLFYACSLFSQDRRKHSQRVNGMCKSYREAGAASFLCVAKGL